MRTTFIFTYGEFFVNVELISYRFFKEETVQNISSLASYHLHQRYFGIIHEINFLQRHFEHKFVYRRHCKKKKDEPNV